MSENTYVRGVVVSTKNMGEIHSNLGIYSEEGLLYASMYGSRSAKGKMRGNDALFIMGRFSIETNKKGFSKVYDLQVYENCYSIATHLPSYYIACACAEMVTRLKGAHHKDQFKLFVHLLLYLTKICQTQDIDNIVKARLAYTAMTLFLWRSFMCNGWQPEFISLNVLKTYEHWYLSMPSGVFEPHVNKDETEGMLHFCIVDALQSSTNMSFENAIEYISTTSQNISTKNSCVNIIYTSMQHLLYSWQHTLECKIWTAKFLLKKEL